MRPRWVKKRDGRRTPFDPQRLHESLVAAAESAGESLLVEEICDVVEFFLEKTFQRSVPSTAEIQDLVERVLLETNHPRTAAAYAERRSATARSRRELRVAELPPLGPDGELPEGPATEPWREGAIARTLAESAGLDPELAEQVASAVEQRLFALGLKRVTARLCRELTHLELSERGLGTTGLPPDEVAVPVRAIRRLCASAFQRLEREPRRPRAGPEALVGRDLLYRHALERALPTAISRAHREGTLHLVDLGEPLRLLSGAVALDHVKLDLGERAPTSAAEVAVALASLLNRAEACHARAIGVPYADVFLAPFARGRETVVRRDLREAYRILAAVGGEPEVRLHLGGVPATLAAERPVGRRGKRWRAGYGDLAAEAALVARLLCEIAAEERAVAGPGRLALVASLGVAAALPGLGALDAVLVDGLGAPGSSGMSGALEPSASTGLAGAGALIEPRGPSPFVAGAARALGIGCARPAFAAGPGNEPGMREGLFGALDLALDALDVGMKTLDAALYRPRLPLWNALGEGRPAPAVEAARATASIGLIGLEEAFAHLLGEAPHQNAAVREVATRLVRDLAARAKEQGAVRGLRVRLEEPPLEHGARRVAEVDLGEHGEVARRLLERNGSEPHYSSALSRAPADAAQARAALDEVYGPLGLAPLIPGGPDLAQRLEPYRQALGLG